MGNRVKRFHMYAGVDLIGSKTSMQETRNVKLEATAIGIRMESAGTNRVVVIPYSNIKGFELYPEPVAINQDGLDQSDLPADAAPAVLPKRRGRPPVKAD